MRDSGIHFILQGAFKSMMSTRSVLMILIKFRENVFS